MLPILLPPASRYAHLLLLLFKPNEPPSERATNGLTTIRITNLLLVGELYFCATPETHQPVGGSGALGELKGRRRRGTKMQQMKLIRIPWKGLKIILFHSFHLPTMLTDFSLFLFPVLIKESWEKGRRNKK